MSSQEVDSVVQGLPSLYRAMLESRTSGTADPAFFKRLGIYHLASRLYRRLEHSFYADVLDSNPSSGQVFNVYPELRDRLDDNGLVSIDEDLMLVEGGIEYRDNILQYHLFFGPMRCM